MLRKLLVDVWREGGLKVKNENLQSHNFTNYLCKSRPIEMSVLIIPLQVSLFDCELPQLFGHFEIKNSLMVNWAPLFAMGQLQSYAFTRKSPRIGGKKRMLYRKFQIAQDDARNSGKGVRNGAPSEGGTVPPRNGKQNFIYRPGNRMWWNNLRFTCLIR